MKRIYEVLTMLGAVAGVLANPTVLGGCSGSTSPPPPATGGSLQGSGGMTAGGGSGGSSGFAGSGGSATGGSQGTGGATSSGGSPGTGGRSSVGGSGAGGVAGSGGASVGAGGTTAFTGAGGVRIDGGLDAGSGRGGAPGSGGMTKGTLDGGGAGGSADGGVADGAGIASACPTAAPSNASPCPTSLQGTSCYYDDCSASGGRKRAVCSSSGSAQPAWAVDSFPCGVQTMCAGDGAGQSCPVGQVCLVLESGSRTVQCVPHSCGTGPITCDCVQGCFTGCSMSSAQQAVTFTCNTCTDPRGCA